MKTLVELINEVSKYQVYCTELNAKTHLENEGNLDQFENTCDLYLTEEYIVDSYESFGASDIEEVLQEIVTEEDPIEKVIKDRAEEEIYTNRQIADEVVDDLVYGISDILHEAKEFLNNGTIPSDKHDMNDHWEKLIDFIEDLPTNMNNIMDSE